MQKSKENQTWSGQSGDSPPSQSGLLGTHAKGWCLKSRQIADVIYDSLFFWCKGWLMSNEGLGRLRGQEEGAGWAHLVGKGLVPPANPGSHRGKATPAAALSLGTGHGHSTGVGRMAGQPHLSKLSQNPPGHGLSWVKGNQLCLFPTTLNFCPLRGLSPNLGAGGGRMGRGGSLHPPALGLACRELPLTCPSRFWHRVA